jgi:hypothetical protein
MGMRTLRPDSIRATPRAALAPGWLIRNIHKPRLFLGALALFPAASAGPTAGESIPPPFGNLRLWYDKPAGQAEVTPGLKGKARDARGEALPAGNGRMTAMVFGGTPADVRILPSGQQAG